MNRSGEERDAKNERTPHEELDEYDSTHANTRMISLTGRPPVHPSLDVESDDWLIPRIPNGEGDATKEGLEHLEEVITPL